MFHKKAWLLGLFVLLSVGLYSQTRGSLADWEDARAERARREGAFLLPDGPTVATLFLNHRAFASTILWIQALLYFGNYRSEKWQQPPENLGTYTHLIAYLDPEFQRIYTWFNALYTQSRIPVSYDELKYAEEVMLDGIEMFPSDGELLFSLAMNYIGYSTDRTKEQRIEELERCLKYLQQCAQLDSCPSQAVSVIPYLLNRKKQLMGEAVDPKAELEAQRSLYLSLYMTTHNTEQRERLEGQLKRLGVNSSQVVEKIRARDATFGAEHRRRYEYLPPAVWALTTSNGAGQPQ